MTLTKAFLTEEAAETEAKRLNELNAERSKRYFVSVVRLVEDPEKPQSPLDSN